MIWEDNVQASDVKKVAVVGTGLMGHGIAQVFALAGYPVALYDANPEHVRQAVAGIGANLDLFRERGLATADEAAAALARLRPCTKLGEAVGDADFVMEAVFEDVEVKKDALRQVAEAAPARAVLASNTSGQTGVMALWSR